MHFLFITLFPEQIEQAAGHSILKRAVDKGLISFSCINPRDFTYDKHRTVDDAPFGGGAGMVLKPEPLVAAIEAAKKILPSARVVALTPSGHPFKQKIAANYAANGCDLIFVCGHYEGFDARIFHWVDEKLSLGDFIVTGGELPALIVMDTVARLLPGVLGDSTSKDEESFSANLLEYPQYTRPVDFQGYCVPEILRNGNHELIRRWRFRQALKETLTQRADLLADDYADGLNKEQLRIWHEVQSELNDEA